MNNKGFTLIELLVVVLIIGILAAMALPQYFKAVERSRMSEAVTLLANIAQSQQRKYLQINSYVSSYNGLDVAPKGAAGQLYCTKYGGSTASAYTSSGCGTGNGFVIKLSDQKDFQNGQGSALRAGSGGTLQYSYELKRYYANTGVQCIGNNENGKALCADFCGIDTYPSGDAGCCSDGAAGNAGSCAQPSAVGTGN